MKILFVSNIRDTPSDQTDVCIAEYLQRLGYAVEMCTDGIETLKNIKKDTAKKNAFDVLLIDTDQHEDDVLALVKQARTLENNADIIILEDDTIPDKTKETVENAAKTDGRLANIKFLAKPCICTGFEVVLKQIAENRYAAKKYNALMQHLQQDTAERKLTGNSEAMQRVYRLINKIAPTESTVVILGDTGTGKELAAKAIHDGSRRAGKPFVAVNCGALPDALIESELFGHRKGSFTGADTNRTGLFEVADGGTLFLDEIGELPKGVQAKLLRFLESGEVRKIGDNSATICDVRVVCATLRNLESMVQSGEFREDLWFRINTFEIHMPPLKDRKEDLPDLILLLAKRFRRDLTQTDAASLFTPEAYRLLLQYDYPGNIRQLANSIEHALVLSDRFPISDADLPDIFKQDTVPANHLTPNPIALHSKPDEKPSRPVLIAKGAAGQESVLPRSSAQELMSFDPSPEAATLRDMEIKAIESALNRHGGNKSKAAEELGISLKTLYNKLNQFEKKSGWARGDKADPANILPLRESG